MKQQDHSTLVAMPVGDKYSLTSDIMRDLKHGENSREAFQGSFFNFIENMASHPLKLSLEVLDTLKRMFTLSLIVRDDPEGFIQSLMLKEFKDSEYSSEYSTLLQNAFIYSVAVCYKSQIKRTYMLASKNLTRTESQNMEYMITGKIDGGYLVGSPDDTAQHSDKEYVNYVSNQHTVFTKFVKYKYRFQANKILAVTGYLIYPKPEEEAYA
jgi:hypothetical protein